MITTVQQCMLSLGQPNLIESTSEVCFLYHIIGLNIELGECFTLNWEPVPISPLKIIKRARALMSNAKNSIFMEFLKYVKCQLAVNIKFDRRVLLVFY